LLFLNRWILNLDGSNIPFIMHIAWLAKGNIIVDEELEILELFLFRKLA